MHCFFITKQPKSFNSWKQFSAKGKSYMQCIKDAYSNYYGHPNPLTGELYGVAYYFYKKRTGTDADNISKPIWDCLTGFLYDDDKAICLRIAACFDLAVSDYKQLDFTGVKPDVIADFLSALDQNDHIVYIECGRYNHTLLEFNLEGSK